MTKQEYYDLLYKSAYDGTFPSFRLVAEDSGDPLHSASCLYRKDRTAGCPQRCAVGLLLPDELYRPSLENIPIEELKDRRGLDLEPILPEGMTLDDLKDCQSAHDNTIFNASPTYEWHPDEFVYRLNYLRCFTGVRKQFPKEDTRCST